jgi:hypothetical protein
MTGIAAALAVLLAATDPYPPLTVPAGWAPYGTPQTPPGFLEWRRAPRPNEPFPTRLIYFVRPSDGTYADEILRNRTLWTCPGDATGELMKSINVCGFVIDTDEQCKGMRAHRFVRLANFGPREIVADTRLYVPWAGGYLVVVYDRPSTEFAREGKGEKEDEVLAAMRSWCEAAATSAIPSPSASPA